MKTQELTIECTHHWIIETPSGRFSKGICNKCKINKLFDNIIDDSNVSQWKVGKAHANSNNTSL